MENQSTPPGEDDSAEDSGLASFGDPETMQRLRLWLRYRSEQRARPWKPPASGGKLGNIDPVGEALDRAWERFAEFKGNTPEELQAWLFQILDEVMDERNPE